MRRRRQGKLTSEDPLERFEKPLPTQKADWYKAHTSPDASETTGEPSEREGDQEPEKEADPPPQESESVWEDDLAQSTELTEEFEEIESDDEGGDDEIWEPKIDGPEANEREEAAKDAEKQEKLVEKANDEDGTKGGPPEGTGREEGREEDSSSRLTRETLEELKKKYEGLAPDDADREKYASLTKDFRTLHREAVKKMGAKDIARFDSSSEAKADEKRVRPRSSGTPGALFLPLAIAAIAVGAVLVIVFSGALGGRPEHVETREQNQDTPMVKLPTDGVDLVLDRFFGAKTWEAAASVVRHPEIVEPLMEDWYTTHPYSPAEFEIIQVNEGMMSTGEINATDQLWIVHLDVKVGSDSTPRTVLLERTEAGYKVDWESYVDHSKIPFEAFASKEGEIPNEPLEFRVSINRSEYHNYDFADPEKWSSFRIQNPYSENVLYGYIKKGPAADAVEPLFYYGEISIPVILKLKYLNADGRKQGLVEIVEVIQKNWVRRY